MKFRFSIVLLILSAFLVGCPGSVMNTRIVNSRYQTLKLEIFNKDGWTGKITPQKVSHIYFYKVLSDTEMDIVWSVNSKNTDGGEELYQITYGEVPHNFSATKVPKAIHPGDKLYIIFDLEKSNLPSPLGSIEVKLDP